MVERLGNKRGGHQNILRGTSREDSKLVCVGVCVYVWQEDERTDMVLNMKPTNIFSA